MPVVVPAARPMPARAPVPNGAVRPAFDRGAVTEPGSVQARETSARPRDFGRSGNPRRDVRNSRDARDTRRAKASPEEPAILFQRYFKSVGPRTYAAQLKQAGNGNHFLVLTEGKRDEKTDEVRKTRLFVFSEDFDAFFRLVAETAEFARTHPVPAEVRRKRTAFWAKKRRQPGEASKAGAAPPSSGAAARPVGASRSGADATQTRR